MSDARQLAVRRQGHHAPKPRECFRMRHLCMVGLVDATARETPVHYQDPYLSECPQRSNSTEAGSTSKQLRASALCSKQSAVQQERSPTNQVNESASLRAAPRRAIDLSSRGLAPRRGIQALALEMSEGVNSHGERTRSDIAWDQSLIAHRLAPKPSWLVDRPGGGVLTNYPDELLNTLDHSVTYLEWTI
jgi:hypothetical protein